MFELQISRKQTYYIEESTCDIFGTYQRPPQWSGAPIVIRRPGYCASLSPRRYAPSCTVTTFSEIEIIVLQIEESMFCELLKLNFANQVIRCLFLHTKEINLCHSWNHKVGKVGRDEMIRNNQPFLQAPIFFRNKKAMKIFWIGMYRGIQGGSKKIKAS